MHHLLAAGPTAVPDELVLVIAAAVVIAVLLHWLRLPVITGLLAAGAVIGPAGLSLVGGEEGRHQLEMLSEIGLILLLFTIGLEFSLRKLMAAWRLVLIGGALQAAVTGGVAFTVAAIAGIRIELAVLIGMMVVMSSTAVVLRGLTERGELDAPHGRFIVGVLIFQDLLVVPMMLVVPILAGKSDQAPAVALTLVVLQTIGVVVAVLLLSRMVVPVVFRAIDRTRSREVFVLGVVAICATTAWATQQFGLSMALGAFLAGMVLADSDFGNRAVGDVLPLRDVLASIFFVSLGMLFDVHVVVAEPVLVFGLLAALVLGKGFIATLAALVMRFPPRVAWLAGVGLAQLSEFGFLLAMQANRAELATSSELAPLLAAGVMSMFLTPLLVRVAPHVTAGERVLRKLERLLGVHGVDELPANVRKGLREHVVIVGYGVGGRLLARALTDAGVPYVVLELNAETVLRSRKAGENIYYGDITSAEAMHHVHLNEARALVLMINDPMAARRALSAVRRHAPRVTVFLRARYLANRPELMALGANDVVFEEVEAAAEMLARLLRRLDFPGNIVRQAVAAARDETQPTRRAVPVPPDNFDALGEVSGVFADNMRISQQSYACGRSLRELDLRAQTGALVVALHREGAWNNSPDPVDPLLEGDLVVLVGSEESVILAEMVLERGTIPATRRLWAPLFDKTNPPSDADLHGHA